MGQMEEKTSEAAPDAPYTPTGGSAGNDVRRLAADSALPDPSGSWSPLLLMVSIPLLFLIYWFFARRWTKPVKRSRKQSTYRCHYPENAQDFSDVEPGPDMI